MKEGDGKIGDTNPLNSIGFNIFYRIFANIFLFFTAYETIFQLTVPEDTIFGGSFLFFSNLQGFGPDDGLIPAFAAPILVFLIELLY